ncbi:MAG TPA: flagellar basal body-associated FliL family protein [Candidatus Limnocylindria bacterium]|jgi:flagellar FliL protein|nr:flagellar basal body-associated FliL family protein [Candidatus Limnocylindria bacterium]
MSAKEADAGAASAAPAKDGGGMKALLPLLLNLVLMPALAFGMTKFVLLPKLVPAHTEGTEEEAPVHGEAKSGGEAHGKTEASGKEGAKEGGKEGKKEGGKPGGKVTANLSGKLLVNVAGTMGTRYLLASVTLVSKRQDFKDLVEKYDAQLKDVAMSTLSSKTIPDLEKPGARNIIRSELISVFNTVLGEGVVSEIYLTEFAIQ